MQAEYIKKLLNEIDLLMNEQREYLITLDSVVGDGDLGLTMGDGFRAANRAVEASEICDIGKLLYMGGKAMSTAVPSTMGTLMASGLMQAGKALKGKEVLEVQDVVVLWQAYFDGVQSRGKAQIGDKTFLDGLAPGIKALSESLECGESLQEAAEKASVAAENGFKQTTTMIAVHGRAATRGEASRSLEDPGAAVAMYLMQAFAKSVGTGQM
ncbi:dihydroxyacetone kinase family protein [Lachnospiraceae bacterium LCP25S3_G4]